MTCWPASPSRSGAILADTVVRLTADRPLIDREVVNQLIAHFRRTGADYASNSASAELSHWARC